VKPLNLASRPFRNERAPALGFALLALSVLGLSAWQAVALRRLLPADGDTVRAEVSALDAELSALEDEEAELLRVRPDRKKQDEWRRVQSLVDQRLFSWTRLLGRLEQVLPPGVRLQAIRPEVDEGVVTLELDAIARTLDDGYRLWEALLRSGDFEGALATSITAQDEGMSFVFTMRYRPEKAPAPAAVVGEAG